MYGLILIIWLLVVEVWSADIPQSFKHLQGPEARGESPECVTFLQEFLKQHEDEGSAVLCGMRSCMGAVWIWISTQRLECSAFSGGVCYSPKKETSHNQKGTILEPLGRFRMGATRIH